MKKIKMILQTIQKMKAKKIQMKKIRITMILIQVLQEREIRV